MFDERKMRWHKNLSIAFVISNVIIQFASLALIVLGFKIIFEVNHGTFDYLITRSAAFVLASFTIINGIFNIGNSIIGTTSTLPEMLFAYQFICLFVNIIMGFSIAFLIKFGEFLVKDRGEYPEWRLSLVEYLDKNGGESILSYFDAIFAIEIGLGILMLSTIWIPSYIPTKKIMLNSELMKAKLIRRQEDRLKRI